MVARSVVTIFIGIATAVAVMATTEEQQRILQLEADKDALALRLIALEAAFAQSIPAGAQPQQAQASQLPQLDRNSVVDTRLMQKPQAFNGDRGSWSDWAFTFRA